ERRGGGSHKGHDPAPAPVAAVAPAEPSPHDRFAGRMTALQNEYDGLVKRYGEPQLTTLEREVTRTALEDFARGHYDSLEQTLKDAEQALKAAHNRLDR